LGDNGCTTDDHFDEAEKAINALKMRGHVYKMNKKIQEALTPQKLWQRSAFSFISIDSFASFVSVWSLFSAGSLLSIGSAGSILSIGSTGSILSIGSVGSVLSIGSAGTILGIGGHSIFPRRKHHN